MKLMRYLTSTLTRTIPHVSIQSLHILVKIGTPLRTSIPCSARQCGRFARRGRWNTHLGTLSSICKTSPPSLSSSHHRIDGGFLTLMWVMNHVLVVYSFRAS